MVLRHVVMIESVRQLVCRQPQCDVGVAFSSETDSVSTFLCIFSVVPCNLQSAAPEAKGTAHIQMNAAKTQPNPRVADKDSCGFNKQALVF